jgi:hypothetical protein
MSLLPDNARTCLSLVGLVLCFLMGAAGMSVPCCSLALDDAVPAKQCDGAVVCVLPCAAWNLGYLHATERWFDQ